MGLWGIMGLVDVSMYISKRKKNKDLEPILFEIRLNYVSHILRNSYFLIDFPLFY